MGPACAPPSEPTRYNCSYRAYYASLGRFGCFCHETITQALRKSWQPVRDPDRYCATSSLPRFPPRCLQLVLPSHQSRFLQRQAILRRPSCAVAKSVGGGYVTGQMVAPSEGFFKKWSDWQRDGWHQHQIYVTNCLISSLRAVIAADVLGTDALGITDITLPLLALLMKETPDPSSATCKDRLSGYGAENLEGRSSRVSTSNTTKSSITHPSGGWWVKWL